MRIVTRIQNPTNEERGGFREILFIKQDKSKLANRRVLNPKGKYESLTGISGKGRKRKVATLNGRGRDVSIERFPPILVDITDRIKAGDVLVMNRYIAMDDNRSKPRVSTSFNADIFVEK